MPSAASVRDPWRSAHTPGERRGDQHADRERRELDAGQHRVVALDALEVEDEHEHQREARQPVDERRGGRGGEQPVAEDRRGRASARARGARSARTPAAARRRRSARRSRPGRSSPRGRPWRRRARGPVRPIDERGRCPRGRARAACPAWRARAGRARPRPRRRAPSGTLNQNTHCQRDRDERAAEHRPEHEADRGDHRVRAHREAELLAREGVRDERGGVGEQERGADALQDPPQDQLRAVGREAGAERGRGEHEEAADVGVLAAEQVGQPARA